MLATLRGPVVSQLSAHPDKVYFRPTTRRPETEQQHILTTTRPADVFGHAFRAYSCQSVKTSRKLHRVLDACRSPHTAPLTTAGPVGSGHECPGGMHMAETLERDIRCNEHRRSFHQPQTSNRQPSSSAPECSSERRIARSRFAHTIVKVLESTIYPSFLPNMSSDDKTFDVAITTENITGENGNNALHITKSAYVEAQQDAVNDSARTKWEVICANKRTCLVVFIVQTNGVVLGLEYVLLGALVGVQSFCRTMGHYDDATKAYAVAAWTLSLWAGLFGLM